jgi:hypothetical protein
VSLPFVQFSWKLEDLRNKLTGQRTRGLFFSITSVRKTFFYVRKWGVMRGWAPHSRRNVSHIKYPLLLSRFHTKFLNLSTNCSKLFLRISCCFLSKDGQTDRRDGFSSHSAGIINNTVYRRHRPMGSKCQLLCQQYLSLKMFRYFMLHEACILRSLALKKFRVMRIPKNTLAGYQSGTRHFLRSYRSSNRQ